MSPKMVKKLTNPATIRINHETLERIKRHGLYGETLDEILNRVLDEVEKKPLSAGQKSPEIPWSGTVKLDE